MSVCKRYDLIHSWSASPLLFLGQKYLWHLSYARLGCCVDIGGDARYICCSISLWWKIKKKPTHLWTVHDGLCLSTAPQCRFQTKMNLKYLPCCIKFYYDHFYWSLIAALLVFFQRNGDTTRCVVNFFLTSSPRRQVISIHHLDIGPLSCFLLVFQHSRNEERSEKEFSFLYSFYFCFLPFLKEMTTGTQKSVMLCGCADISVRGQWSAHFHSVEPVFFFSFSFWFLSFSPFLSTSRDKWESQ